jgi:hypothetical protein
VEDARHHLANWHEIFFVEHLDKTTLRVVELTNVEDATHHKEFKVVRL